MNLLAAKHQIMWSVKAEKKWVGFSLKGTNYLWVAGRAAEIRVFSSLDARIGNELLNRINGWELGPKPSIVAVDGRVQLKASHLILRPGKHKQRYADKTSFP